MIISAFEKVSKMFGGHQVFNKLSFEIKENNRVGLVGRNGSGKTTIFKLLSGLEEPDGGKIHLKKGTKVGYLQQIPSFSLELTAEDVLLTAFSEVKQLEGKMKELEEHLKEAGANEEELASLLKEYGLVQERFTALGGYEVDAYLHQVAEGLNIRGLMSQKFHQLSGGEKTKVGLGLILLQRPDLLLLDEPTNHLDISAVEWLEQFLKDYRGTVVMISHDRYFLDETATKILDLEDGELTLYHTNYTAFVKQKEEKLLQEFNVYQEQQKKIKKMKETIKRLKEWANQANPPNAGLHRRAKSMEKALERMEKVKRPVVNHKKMGLQFEHNGRSGKDVIVVRNLTKSLDNRLLFQEVDLHLQFQERAVIVGQNGTGKTTILKCILGELQVDSGEIKIGSNTKIGYLTQHIQATNPEQTVIDAFREDVVVTEGEARHILAKFLFYGPAVFQKVKGLSGGEKMRLRLAQLMYQDVNVFILDEPTNHLDIESREVLEDALEDFSGTILAVSHDRYFLDKLFDKTYWLENQNLTSYVGNYSWAKQKRRETISEPASQPKKERKGKQTVKQKLKSLSSLEKEIEQVEQKLLELEDKLLGENDVISVKERRDEMARFEGIRSTLYAEWEQKLL